MSLEQAEPRPLVDRLEWFARQIVNGVIITDARGAVQWVNDGFTRISGFTIEELRGRRPGELLQGPETSGATVRRMRAAIDARRPFLVEVLNYARDGRPYWVHIDCHPVHAPDGTFEGFMALEIDITDRYLAERARQQGEVRYRSLFEHAHDAILIVNDDGAYVDANPAALRLLGHPREALLGRSVHDFVADGTAASRWSTFAEDGAQRSEIALRRADGSVCTVEYNAVRNFMPGLHLSMLRDVTERRQAEIRARRSDRLEALGTLAGGIAHDFSNILTGMLGQLAVAREELRERGADPVIDASLEAIAQGGGRARDLIRRILGFSRLHEPSREPIRLEAVVTEATRLLRDLLPAMVELHVDIAPDCPQMLGDATALHQVVMNLGMNAWHALPELGGTIRVRVEHTRTPPAIPELAPCPSGPLLCLIVEDTGHGMDAATRGRIFEPLFTTKPAGQGTGLGLAGVLSIVTSHGGAVQVESEPGRGARFSVWLPTLEATDATPTPISVPASRERLVGRVVLVDDDPQTRAALERMLRHLGLTVEAYGDPREGLARVLGSPSTVDLLLTDLAMPALRGDRLAAACREVRADLPVLVLSGYLEDEMRAQLLADQIGALDKPPSLEGLAAAIGARLTRA